MSVIKLHRFALSGHAHRVELFISLLGLPVKLVDVDLIAGEHFGEAFRAKNKFSQVPVLEDGDVILSDSIAILHYLAQKYDASGSWLPTDAVKAARVQQFLSMAAGQAVNGPAMARLATVFGADVDQKLAIENSHKWLTLLDEHLATEAWLAGDQLTIADIANYSYIAHAPEGGVSLESYPNVRAWLVRIEELDGFVGMQATAVGLAA